MISLNKVTKTYPGDFKALNKVSLHIEKEEFVFISGHSGAGKTTLLDLILKKTDPTSGTLTVNGIRLDELTRRQVYRYRRFIGMVFQDFRLFDDFNVYENVAIAQRIIEADAKQIQDRVMEALTLTGVKSKAKLFPGQLSAGEKQKVAIARAIVNQPVILLADEPTGNLDRKSTIDIMELIAKINSDRGTTVVVASHNTEIIQSMHKRIIT